MKYINLDLESNTDDSEFLLNLADLVICDGLLFIVTGFYSDGLPRLTEVDAAPSKPIEVK